eukprot:TRINITY_DN15632_c0_g1_i2.p1 TRINITY_DN15632_c0_g1~~TRINITY_DN15632_c0_g1_i2.p1  ORF type:complete len:331 (+),score=48.99 TRINITY_DN15632_c0_g1_i2:78-1070(+)
MIRRPPRSTLSSSSAASDVYKRQLARYEQALAIKRCLCAWEANRAEHTSLVALSVCDTARMGCMRKLLRSRRVLLWMLCRGHSAVMDGCVRPLAVLSRCVLRWRTREREHAAQLLAACEYQESQAALQERVCDLQRGFEGWVHARCAVQHVGEASAVQWATDMQAEAMRLAESIGGLQEARDSHWVQLDFMRQQRTQTDELVRQLAQQYKVVCTLQRASALHCLLVVVMAVQRARTQQGTRRAVAGWQCALHRYQRSRGQGPTLSLTALMQSPLRSSSLPQNSKLMSQVQSRVLASLREVRACYVVADCELGDSVTGFAGEDDQHSFEFL